VADGPFWGEILNEEGFKQWLEARGLAQNSIATRMSAVRRIERILSDLGIQQSDLDAAFEHDSLQSTKAALEKLKVNATQGGQDYRKLLPDSDAPVSRLENFIAWLGNYRSFKEGLSELIETDADRIRQYVLDNYVVPARERGNQFVSVKVREVHDALSMSQAWANVCQAIAGPKFQILANVAPPSREGAEASPATTFTFDLHASPFSIEAVERELVRRFGDPSKSVQKILAFQLPDGREIALDKERPPAQLWIEATQPIPSEFRSRPYAAKENRHHGLPTRLNHASTQARPVAMVRVNSMSEMSNLLDWYLRRSVDLNRDQLERYKRLFLARYTDFEPMGFAAEQGGYFAEERTYKDALIERARSALTSLADQDDATLGGQLLDILTGKTDVPSDLLGWRTNDRIKALRAQHPNALEREAGRLARADDVDAAISNFVEAIWPILMEGQSSKPYSESRNIPTMLAALVHPTSAYGINTDPVSRLARALTGEPIMGWNPLTPKEYADVLALVESSRDVMKNEWGWAPRDLWDVQGFVWAVHRPDQPQLSDGAKESGHMDSLTVPTNLILYGPPGTGKTFATAREAVILCNGSAPENRDKLMEEYARLAASGRIEFVTFHQSYSYEEFVEGLRPHQGNGETTGFDEEALQNQEGGHQSAGFKLVPEPGLFRRIARRAETSTGPGKTEVRVGERRVFKMSIGEAANPEDAYLFEEALEGGYTLLGFGNIDWTDARFENREAFIEAWKEARPGDAVPNAMGGRVQCPYIFRNWMREGDLVIVSKGNSLFRAIGIVTGGYEYVPRESGDYCHRRAVRWLWHDRSGASVEDIYARGFSMRSIYLLTHADLSIPALERYIASQQPSTGGTPESFVLIIDEINRGNISKVFGELITLLEADKRLNAKNELKVRLPYSREMFGVPANLHVVGTMNTADRSIALLDTALRRRFEFRELMPDPAVLTYAGKTSGVNLIKMLGTINERIEYLFDREHQIGHAYFVHCKSQSDVDAVMRHKVIPLLAEYFYEDWTKVATVLGDAKGEGHFLERTLLKAPAGFDVDDGAEPRYRWSIKTAFSDIRYEQFQ
jgi:5-methylcytosine-specific restriction enzyme B